jgi:hypothetical protein
VDVKSDAQANSALTFLDLTERTQSFATPTETWSKRDRDRTVLIRSHEPSQADVWWPMLEAGIASRRRIDSQFDCTVQGLLRSCVVNCLYPWVMVAFLVFSSGATGCGSSKRDLADAATPEAHDAPGNDQAIDESMSDEPADVSHDPDAADASELSDLSDVKRYPAADGEGPDCRGEPTPGINPIPLAQTYPPIQEECPAAARWCGTSACGNGRRDSCSAGRSCGGDDDVVHESCDTSDLNGASCQSLGYAGGTLGCTVWCGFDVTACVTCAAPGGGVIGCGRSAVAVAGSPVVVRVTVRDTEAGIVWLSRTLDGSSEIGFARLGPDLSVLSQTAIGGVDEATNRVYDVSLATMPTEWAVFASRQRDVKVVYLDGDGHQKATTLVLPDMGRVSVGSRPQGGPLLSWMVDVPQDAGVAPTPAPGMDAIAVAPNPPLFFTRAALLADDGTSLSTPVTLMDHTPDIDRDIAFVGDGFLVAARTETGIGIARVELDGSTTGAVSFLSSADSPNIAVDGTTVRLKYSGDEGMYQVDLDRRGRLGTAKSLIAASDPSGIVQGSVLVAGVDTLVLAGGPSHLLFAAPYLDFLRLSGDGKPRRPSIRVGADPAFMKQFSLTHFGAEVLVAWISGGCPATINLARVTP